MSKDYSVLSGETREETVENGFLDSGVLSHPTEVQLKLGVNESQV
jgi:hypothetical protein